jgi:hypothetical protein
VKRFVSVESSVTLAFISGAQVVVVLPRPVITPLPSVTASWYINCFIVSQVQAMDWFKVKKTTAKQCGRTSSILPKSKSNKDCQKPSGTESGDDRGDIGYEASWSAIVNYYESDE